MRDAFILVRLGAEFLKKLVAPSPPVKNQGIAGVAEEFELRQGVQPAGGARIAGNEDQLAVFDARRRPLEGIVQMRGLIVLVNAEKADVQIVAWILEIVGVAAEKGGLE